MIIAIDFDGTMIDQADPDKGDIVMILKPDAKEAVNRLFSDGHQIIIWSCRGVSHGLVEMKNFLDENGIKYHKINENSDLCDIPVPYPKIQADIWIDDKGINGIPEWNKIYDKISKGDYYKC